METYDFENLTKCIKKNPCVYEIPEIIPPLNKKEKRERRKMRKQRGQMKQKQERNLRNQNRKRSRNEISSNSTTPFGHKNKKRKLNKPLQLQPPLTFLPPIQTNSCKSKF